MTDPKLTQVENRDDRWCYLSDDEAWLIERYRTLDIDDRGVVSQVAEWGKAFTAWVMSEYGPTSSRSENPNSRP